MTPDVSAEIFLADANTPTTPLASLLLSEDAANPLTLTPNFITYALTYTTGASGGGVGDPIQIGLEAIQDNIYTYNQTIAFDNVILYQQLHEANNQLEDRVAQRTRALMQANRRLSAQWVRLQRANGFKNEILGTVAHDLKNPLTIITFSADLLPSNTDPAQIKRIAKAISEASSRMRDLITNLLDANAIEQGLFTSNIQCCDLNLLVAQCVENNEPAAAKKQINICAGYSEKVLAKADRAATMQILENLLSNALKFSPPNTRIHVHTLPEKDHVAVTVRDEGPGISEADRAKLFKKFSRLTAQPTGGESSTGLGLSIVKRLAESMSGTILCQSELGSGAKFTLRLPIWSGKAEINAMFSADTQSEAAPNKAALPQRERGGYENLLPPASMRN